MGTQPPPSPEQAAPPPPPEPGDAGDARHALFHAALAGTGTFVWGWDLDTDRLSDVEEGLAMLGYRPGDIGPTQADWDRLIHPDDLAANHEAYLRHARGEVDVYEHCYRIRDAAGRWRWVRERGRIVERSADGRPRRMLGTQTDITELRELADTAQQALEGLARIARHVPGTLVQIHADAERRITFPYASERCRALFGIEPAELARDGRALLDCVEPEDRGPLRAAIRASARTLEPWRAEFRVRRAGQLRWVRGEATPSRQADGSTVWHGYLEDATERRELEQARQDAAVAAAANRAKTEFLSRMSHELRTPLNAVLGFAQLLESDPVEPPSESQQRRIKLIREAGEHLLQMIGDLLDLTRIESGGIELRLAAVPLRPLAEEALAMVAGSAERAQVTLALADTSPGACVRADGTRLRQVLLNLLTNAIKYNRAGGRVELEIAAPQGRWQPLAVHDTGIGIARDERERLFEPFYRGRAVRGRVEGTGIGLALTQDLVVLMGGRIEVDSEPGRGSSFTVTLPAA
ncbi:PAS domain-containing sensor histidine kinase [Rubrivivax sp. JA1024]|nr:PAS domain-containing sensor histidine kinase [Rubrivivax sp. JA1024]